MKAKDRTQLDPERTGTPPAGEAQQQLRTIGPFRVLRLLGEGGMGAVYLAYDDQNHRPVALKVLPEALARDKDYVARFQREARNSALLNHPSIVRGFDVGHDPASGFHYLVLEYVDGDSAHALLDQRGKLDVSDAVHIVLDVARALEHAHSRNVIHRDIKPDNILLTTSGVAKLADLGLAKRTDEPSDLSTADKTFGTPHYMPPEQSRNAKHADHRSDLFALGATFYHLLTGLVPFDASNLFDLYDQKADGQYPPASQRTPDVPRSLDPILARLLAADPNNRFQTASELIVELERTGLGAGVPSFADPEQALQDPYVRERIVTSAQATQPDLGSVPASVETPPPTVEPHWFVRFHDEEGQLRRLQMSKRALEQRLRKGRLPADAEVSLYATREYKPVGDVEEFRALVKAPAPNGHAGAPRPKTGIGPRKTVVRHRHAEAEPPDGPDQRLWFNAYLAGAILLALGVVVLLLLLLP